MERFDDIPKYRKKSQARPPKKSKHKHLSEPCIIESPADWWKKEHERSGEIKREFYGYCPICGMIRAIDRTPWYAEKRSYVGKHYSTEYILTEAGQREMNPGTRTFPFFKVDFEPWFGGMLELQSNK